MRDEGIQQDGSFIDSNIPCTVTEEFVEIGRTRVRRHQTDSKSKVPDILFYDVPQHLAVLEWLLQDFTLGEHLLLVGNQGL